MPEQHHEILEAVKDLDARKGAVSVTNEEATNLSQVEALLDGTGLDLRELVALKDLILQAPKQASGHGVPPDDILYGMWLDGILTGLSIAEARQKERLP